MLDESSHVLNRALKNSLHFKTVTIVVPSTWRDSKCKTVIRTPKGDTPYGHADVLVSSEHPIHGWSPYTQQSKGCGQSGDFIGLPYDFFTDFNRTWEIWGNPAKLFANEFAKFRFGIFDEFGFNRDKLYPNVFFHHGQLVPTGTSNTHVQGGWVSRSGVENCDPIKNECFFQANATQNPDVKCSLGNFHFLPNVHRYCDPEEIKYLTPTKHNIACNGKSAIEVIMSHPDFKRINVNKARASSNLSPTFEIVRSPLPQYVLLMETTDSMDSHDQWKWINKAAQKFIRYDLPVNSNLAIVTFNDMTKVEHNMVRINSDDIRARLADAIPDKYHLSRSTKKCVLCALQSVFNDVLSTENLAGTHIILMTKGSHDSLSVSDENILKNYISDYNIKLSTIIIPSEPESSYPFYDSLQDGNRNFVINNKDNIMDFYVDLNMALSDILSSDSLYPTEQSQLIHKQGILGVGPLNSTGSFLIDSTLGRDTVFGIYVEDEEEHRIKSISFMDTNGAKYGPFLRMSSTFDLVNFKTINFPSGKAPSFNAVRI